ncbi:MAG: phosphoribosylamine--glycine ligase [Planctomycetes bacterium]|nr:phosphoribosylamine--glycine ligase [Planctomycetota bacterium]
MTDTPAQPIPERLNVLLIGSGGREHALAWRLSQSPRLGKLFVESTAHPGLLALGAPCTEDLGPRKMFQLERWFEREKIGLVIVGPEVPLAEGIADRLAAPNRPVFGPVKAAARIESDKAFSKTLMRQTSIPTAEGRTFTSLEAALAYVTERDEPCVVKAAGLCAGKGVSVCETRAEAIAAVRACMDAKQFGDAGQTVVIEERLEGQEVSVLALVDGRTITLLDTVQDHKQVGEGDKGPNTGGMGTICPTPLLGDEELKAVARDVFVPAVDGLRRQGVEYRGVLFAGLMLTPAGPKVLEFNCRFGDPETQVLLARFQGDLLETLWLTTQGRLAEAQFSFDPRPACCVVVCSAGYPSSVRKGDRIDGLTAVLPPSADHGIVFQAGTQADKSGQILTAGGRVAGATCLGNDLADACAKATALAESIRFEGGFFRRDIGARLLNKAFSGR